MGKTLVLGRICGWEEGFWRKDMKYLFIIYKSRAPHYSWWFGERRAFSFCVYHFSFPSSFFNVTHNITKLISKHFNSILLFTITLSRQQNSWFEKWRSFFLCVYHFSFPSFFFNVTRNITKSISKHFNSILLLTIFYQ